MNGITKETGFSSTHSSARSPADISQLVQALEAIYDPRSSNKLRQEATVFLEQTKLHSHASQLGFELAQDKQRPPVIRYYGLSLLEYPIRYQWEDIGGDKAYEIREQVVELANNVSDEEPAFLRNKIAQLWVEIAKRSWLVEWLNMDEMLCGLWEKSLTHREIVLHVLETISDEVFTKEDATAGLRGDDLGKACVEIFTSSSVMSQHVAARPSNSTLSFRHGDKGWLERLAEMLLFGLENQNQQTEKMKECMAKVLGVIRSTMPWIMPKAVANTNLVSLFGRCLTIDHPNIQMATVDAMHALFHRQNLGEEDIVDLVCPFLSSEGLSLIREAYRMICTSHEDIEEPKYSTLKKFTEILCALGLFLDRRPELINQNGKVPEFLQILVDTFQNPSLVVSLPILYVWTKILASPILAASEVVSPHLKTLLEICAIRLIRYEALPEEHDDATVVFLNEDFDTVPEKHAFLGNYRRFCCYAIDRIVRQKPNDAMYHILGQAQYAIENLYQGEAPFDKSQYKSNSMSYLMVDAHATIIAVAVKPYQKWLASPRAGSENRVEQSDELKRHVEQWSRSLLHTEFQDPVIQKRVLRLLIEISTALLPVDSSLPLEICERVFTSTRQKVEGTSPYEEALKDLYASQPKDLQKLVRSFSDSFWPIYDKFRSMIEQLCTSECIEEKTKIDYRALLYIIILRTREIGDQEREQRIAEMVDNISKAWQDPRLKSSVSTFRSFIEMLGIEDCAQYFFSQNAHQAENWTSSQLDAQGMELRDKILGRYDVLPLQQTRSLVGLSIDPNFDSLTSHIVRIQWKRAVPMILPQLLHCLSHAHTFSNPATWGNPTELQSIIGRIFQDRVWQSGISSESRDDFFAKVKSTKSTLEGLASAIRGSIRNVREQCYWVLDCMSRFEEDFYSHSDLPEPLAKALLADAHALSAHQFSVLLKLSSTLSYGCPSEFRAQFLPPLLTLLFKQLDAKITSDWQIIDRRKEDNEAESSLDKEMKDESVLRQLTHSAVLFVSQLLHNPWQGMGTQHRDNSFRGLILATPSILEPMIVFCTHTLRMRDSRSCSIITQVLRNLAPEFGRGQSSSDNTEDETSRAQVREFFCTEILKACITSLHEPYFAELQKELAALIASILSLYSSISSKPREVLLSLPGMSEKNVDEYLHRLVHYAPNPRQQRSLVLIMLESIRGVSIHEQGKVVVTNGNGAGGGRGHRTKTTMQEQFSNDNVEMEEDGVIKRGGTPNLEGVADLFG